MSILVAGWSLYRRGIFEPRQDLSVYVSGLELVDGHSLAIGFPIRLRPKEQNLYLNLVVAHQSSVHVGLALIAGSWVPGQGKPLNYL